MSHRPPALSDEANGSRVLPGALVVAQAEVPLGLRIGPIVGILNSRDQIEATRSHGFDHSAIGRLLPSSLQAGDGGLGRPQALGELALRQARSPSGLTNDRTAGGLHRPMIADTL